MLVRPTALARQVIGFAIEVHRTTGPGLLESTYEHCMVHELVTHEVPFLRQVPVPVIYKGVAIDCAYRADLIVAGELLIEIKSVDRLMPIHQAQVLTYLKLLRLEQAMLMNFNSRRLVDGLQNILLSSTASAQMMDGGDDEAQEGI
jgi:GxxExxY protein